MTWEEIVELRKYELDGSFELTDTSASIGEAYGFTPTNTWTEA